MGKAIMITSFKGGVGKSTLAVNLCAGFAAKDYKVLIIDLDASSGSIDLFMGCESDAIYNFVDVLEERAEIAKAVCIKNNKSGANIDLLKSPPFYMNINKTSERIKKFIEEAKKIYDFIIFDCPPGKFELFEYIAKNCDLILAVTLHSAASIRAAEKLALSLSEIGAKSENVRLIINCFNAKGISKGFNLGIIDIIERSKIKLIGLIENNNLICDYQELGKTCYDIKNKKLKLYFEDIIGRILENNIVLNKKYKGVKIKDLYFNKIK